MTQVPDAAAMKAFNQRSSTSSAPTQARWVVRSRAATCFCSRRRGAKSGKPRLAPLAYLTDRRQADHHRLEGRGRHATPTGCTTCGPTRRRTSRSAPTAYDVNVHELPQAERDEIFAKVVAAAPNFGEYQENTKRIIPLFELIRA